MNRISKLISKFKSQPKLFSKAPSKNKISQTAYKVFTFVKGKKKLIASGLPENLAKQKGVSEVLKSLRGSFKLQESGTTSTQDINYKIPKGFRMSKVDAERFVQEKNTRFGSGTETREAQFFRKQKVGKMKWFT